MKWQPIETAPKDETRVLLHRSLNSGIRRISCGSWNADSYTKNSRPYWGDDLERITGRIFLRKHPPTHWMPLPDPPEDSK